MSAVLRPAGESDRLLIKNIFNLYQNDLSEYCDGFEYLDAGGYFDPGASSGVLPFGDGVFPYIITENGKTVGFIMYTDKTYAPTGCAWCLEEMYLIRPARGRGLATDAAAQVFTAHPGRWSLSVYERNAPARRFWERVIQTCGVKLSEAPGENGMRDVTFDIPAAT